MSPGIVPAGRMTAATRRRRTPGAEPERRWMRRVAHPLDAFYAEAGLGWPPVQVIEARSVPEPYRRLLVHTDDMTPTLERFFGRTIRLAVVGRRRVGEEYCREVVLRLDGNSQAVEFGANRIRLDAFPGRMREAILAEREPLGYLLREFGVAHTCRPNAFLRVVTDATIHRALALPRRRVLYGRHNRLFDPQGRLLSEVVEILAPIGRSRPAASAPA